MRFHKINYGFITFASLLTLSFQPALASTPLCHEKTSSCLTQTAKSYIDALLTHDPSNIPLADHAKRWENGVTTGKSGVEIKKSLKDGLGFKTIKNIRELRWFVDGDQVFAMYLLDSNFPLTSVHYGTTHAIERFQIKNGLIEEIECIFCTSASKKAESSRMDSKMSYLCNRSWI